MLVNVGCVAVVLPWLSLLRDEYFLASVDGFLQCLGRL